MSDIIPAPKTPYLEVDIINRYVLDVTDNLDVPSENNPNRVLEMTYKIRKEVMDRFLSEVISDWHSDTDQLEFVKIYKDRTIGTCQKRKQKYNFATQTSSWQSYQFRDFTQEQAESLIKRLENLMTVSRLTRHLQIESHITKISEEKMFFDSTLQKRLGERNLMLSASDWRVLPDIEDSYEGEKELWKQWRARLRNIDIFTKEFDDELSFFKAIKTMKWPIDPAMYRAAYPDGKDPDGNPAPAIWTDDEHFQEREINASKDFVEQRLLNIVEWRDRAKESNRIVSAEVQAMMKLMKVEDFVTNGIDYSLFYSEDDLDDMAN